MFMVMMVLDNYEKLDEVLTAMKGAGFSGVTIIESTGFFRRFSAKIPMRYAYGAQDFQEKGNATLFAEVDNEDLLQNGLEAVQAVVGDFNNENTGIYCAWPLMIAKGIQKS